MAFFFIAFEKSYSQAKNGKLRHMCPLLITRCWVTNNTY